MRGRGNERARTRRAYAQFAGRVLRARAAAGLSQEALARRAGLCHRTVQRFENARAMPRLDTAAALAKALGIEVGRLAGDE